MNTLKYTVCSIIHDFAMNVKSGHMKEANLNKKGNLRLFVCDVCLYVRVCVSSYVPECT